MESQRLVANNSNLKMIELSHVYYGNIRVWASMAEDKVTDIQYIDNGYLLSTADITILMQIPEVLTGVRLIAAEISSILSSHNYVEDGQAKTITESDIIYWKFKRVKNVDEIEVYYEFEGFVVRSVILMGRKDEQISQMAVTEMEAIGNKNNKLR